MLRATGIKYKLILWSIREPKDVHWLFLTWEKEKLYGNQASGWWNLELQEWIDWGVLDTLGALATWMHDRSQNYLFEKYLVGENWVLEPNPELTDRPRAQW